MSAKLRLGVIGAGSYAVASHLPNLQRWSDRVVFDAVCRIEPDLLTRVQERFGFAHASVDWQDVIARRPDIVLVGSPAALHHQHVKAALEAGAHVLCEKPFTISPNDAWDLVATADRVERHLLVAFGRNYLPVVDQARELMTADGGVGEVEHVSMHMASVHRELLLGQTAAHPSSSQESVPDPRTWTDPTLSGGGYGQGQLSHLLGVALWLTGLRTQEVFALMSGPGEAKVEYHVAAAIRFRSGAIGTMSGGACHMGANDNRQQFELRIIGSEGQLHLDLERDMLWRYRQGGDDVYVPLPDRAGLYNCDGPVDALVQLASGEAVLNNSPGELGARAVELLDGAYRSSRSGQPTTVVDRKV